MINQSDFRLTVVQLSVFYPNATVKNFEVRPEIVNLQMWNKSSVKALEKCKVRVKNPVANENFKIDFVIVDEEFTSLPSGNAAQAMGLITINYENFEVVETDSIQSSSSYLQKLFTKNLLTAR